MSVELKELDNGKPLEVCLTGKRLRDVFAHGGAVGQTARQAPEAWEIQ